jgi:diaminopimelate epimerase
MTVRFTKMQGTGNDFILVDEWAGEAVSQRAKEGFVRTVCDRHFGVGSDGAIFAQRSRTADANFAFYNPDGSRAEMCGNGIRCLAKYLFEHNLVRKGAMSVETLAGVRSLELTVVEDVVVSVKVDMGRPQVRRSEAQVAGDPDDTFVNQKADIGGQTYALTAVGMGNPHAVVFVANVDLVDVRRAGSDIRRYTGLFPNGTNVHFVQRVRENEFRIRTYERGVEDETLACGTGICASAVAAVLNHRADPRRQMLFHSRGGEIMVELEGTGSDLRRAYLIGAAEEVFRGEIDL